MNPQARILLSHPKYVLGQSTSGARFILSGDLDSGGAARVFEAMEKEPLDAELSHLDLEELELLDGSAVALMVDLIRLLLDGSKRVEVLKSPQSLAHTLYRVGMLEGDSRLVLIEPREEEGTTN